MAVFSKMKLASKLALGFGLILTLLLVVAYTGFSSLVTLKEEVAIISETRIPQLSMVSSILKNFDQAARAVRNLPLTNDDAINKREKDAYDKGKAAVSDTLGKLEKSLVTVKGREFFKTMQEKYLATLTYMDKAVQLGFENKNEEAADVILNKMVTIQSEFLAASDAFINYTVELSEKAGKEAVGNANAGQTISAFLGCLGLVLGVLITFLITRSATKPIRRVVEGLTAASDQIASASSQVSSSSNQLAGGTSEQAAAIEETSSSLEEMSSMTKQNAANANHANQLMTETRETVSRATASMDNLTRSMAEISKASEETSKIIRTIDEIAFQTNLLALNAAVEAARAGEAGAGVAVVADEVRNLAMRAAEAAKNTANLIEGTVKSVKEGSEFVQKTDGDFREVAESVAKCGELVGEISAASQEQSQGIAQVNTAVGEMDKVVQQNASSAEESAAASEEMNAQAAQLQEFVGDLVSLVEGSTGSRSANISQPAKLGTALMQTSPRMLKPLRGKANGKGNGDAPALLNSRKPSPEQVIPLDDAEISEF